MVSVDGDLLTRDGSPSAAHRLPQLEDPQDRGSAGHDRRSPGNCASALSRAALQTQDRGQEPHMTHTHTHTQSHLC